MSSNTECVVTTAFVEDSLTPREGKPVIERRTGRLDEQNFPYKSLNQKEVLGVLKRFRTMAWQELLLHTDQDIECLKATLQDLKNQGRIKFIGNSVDGSEDIVTIL